MPEIPEILTKAADVIDERGWWRDGFVPHDAEMHRIGIDTCPVCVLAAINVAAGDAPDAVYDPDNKDERTGAAVALAKHLNLTLEGSDALTYAIGDEWNDKLATSAEQVTAALRECAAELAKGATS